MLGDLSDREQQLVDAARRGARLVCSDLDPDRLAVSEDDPNLEIRAELIRELLLGRRGTLDPRGLRLAGARIAGELDLDNVPAGVGLALKRCVIPEPITAHDAHLPWLDLSVCRLHSLYAPQIRIDGQLILSHVRITSSGHARPISLFRSHSLIHLLGAHIGGQLLMNEAQVTNDSGTIFGAGPAVHADQIRVDGSLDLTGARITAATKRGAIRLPHAHVGGQTDLTAAEVTNTQGTALQADGFRADSGLQLADTRLTGSEEATVRLIGAHVGDELDLSNAEITNHSGPALHADDLQADRSVELIGARLTGAGELGAICMIGAHIHGVINFRHAVILNNTGPALYAHRLHVEARLNLDDARAVGASEDGALRLLDARVSRLDCNNAEITNHSGPALQADALHTHDDLRLVNARLTGTTGHGTLRVVAAHIGGQLVLDNAEITNDTGPAVTADRLHIDTDIRICGARIAGSGQQGAVRLPGARIDRELILDDTELINNSGAILDLRSATVGTTIRLSASVICTEPTRRPSCPQLTKVRLSGFTYHSLTRSQWWEWLHIIRCHTPIYQPGPYQQLAAIERTAGHDNNARHILITQQHDLRQRAPDALGGWWTRQLHTLWGILAGYGYRTRRTAAALLLALLTAGALGYWAGHVTTNNHHAAERTTTFTTKTGQPCTTIELIAVGLDRGLPLATTGIRTRCDLNTDTTAGQTFTATIWLIQATIWALATLTLAGYTNLIRKTG
jgi:hypothetical protein